jgi:hypothetical protein
MKTGATAAVILSRGCPTLNSEPRQTEESEPQLLRQRRWGVVFAVFVLAAGMVLVPFRATGFRLTNLPGDEIDSHFNLYVLEHGWQWLSGKQPRFWDAPFFYPQPNVLAYSDNHLGTLPLYAVFRIVGLDRETAFQCWFLTLFVLNYCAALWVLRRWQTSWSGAAAGAYLFAFGLPLVMQLGHVQLIPRFPVPLAAHFGVRLCRSGRAREALGLGAMMVWQCYATIYVGYFLILFLAVFLSIYAVLYWRTELAAAVRRVGWEALLPPLLLLTWAYASLPQHPRGAAVLAAAGLLYGGWRYRDLVSRIWGEGGWRRLCSHFAVLGGCCLALSPLLRPYLEMSRERGGRSPLEILCMTPQPNSWLNPPACSLCWGRWHSDLEPVFFPGEHILFLGVLPSCMLVLALVGAASRLTLASRQLAGAAALAFVVLFLFTLNVRGYCLYSRLIFLPGVSAIRAVTRIVLVLMFPAALVVACGIAVLQQWIVRKRTAVQSAVVAVALVALVVVDQAVDAGFAGRWTKQQCQARVAALVAEVLQRDPAARLFVDVRFNGKGNSWEEIRQQITAMSAAQRLGIPTLNGYSGWSPQGWIAFRRWEHYRWWKAAIVDRVGEDKLRKRVPGYADIGFGGLVLVGDLGPAGNEPCTRMEGPLPPEGFRARLEMEQRPARMQAGEVCQVVLRVVNTSSTTWRAIGGREDAFRIGACYRWLSVSGREAPTPRAYQYLWHDVAPSAQALLEVELQAPHEPGRYILEWDMIQRGAGCFSDKGSAPLRFVVEVVERGK